jgi:hypothetical protein
MASSLPLPSETSARPIGGSWKIYTDWRCPWEVTQCAAHELLFAAHESVRDPSLPLAALTYRSAKLYADPHFAGGNFNYSALMPAAWITFAHRAQTCLAFRSGQGLPPIHHIRYRGIRLPPSWEYRAASQGDRRRGRFTMCPSNLKQPCLRPRRKFTIPVTFLRQA